MELVRLLMTWGNAVEWKSQTSAVQAERALPNRGSGFVVHGAVWFKFGSNLFT